MSNALDEARSLLALGQGREGPETLPDVVQCAIASALIAIAEGMEKMIEYQELEVERQETHMPGFRGD